MSTSSTGTHCTASHPILDECVLGAELCRDEGKLNPLVANLKLRRHLERLGATIRRRAVTAIEPSADSVTVRAGERYRARRVLLAAAWGTEALAAGLSVGIPVAHEPLHMNITEPVAYGIEHLVQHAERSITFKQLTSGQIVIGGGWPARLDPPDTIPGVLEESLLGNVALAGRIVPGIAELRLLRTWAGLNTTADGKTILGRLPRHDNITVAVPGDAGYTLGPLIGRAAAAITLGKEAEFDVTPYRPDRFAALRRQRLGDLRACFPKGGEDGFDHVPRRGPDRRHSDIDRPDGASGERADRDRDG